MHVNTYTVSTYTGTYTGSTYTVGPYFKGAEQTAPTGHLTLHIHH